MIKFFKNLFKKEVYTYYNIYNPSHYNICDRLVDTLLINGQYVDDIKDIYEKLQFECLKYNIDFTIHNYFVFRGEWYRRRLVQHNQNIQNNYPPLLDNKPNEIILKEKKFHRDSKGRFAKKG